MASDRTALVAGSSPAGPTTALNIKGLSSRNLWSGFLWEMQHFFWLIPLLSTLVPSSPSVPSFQLLANDLVQCFVDA